MRNPFRPTFGASPYHWAGRSVVLEEFARSLDGYPGEPSRSMVIDGARGIGKTVLLTELEDIAAQHGWIVLRATGREDSVRTLVDTTIPAKIAELAPPAGRTVTAVQVSGFRVDTELLDPTDPVPTLGTRMRDLLGLLTGTGVLITVDEVQDADPDNLSAIAVTHQDLIRDDHHVALAMAGLTHGINRLLDLPGTTFLRRARRFELGPLTDDDARAILLATAEDSKPIDADAADLAVDIARGYPYLVSSSAIWRGTGRVTASPGTTSRRCGRRPSAPWAPRSTPPPSRVCRRHRWRICAPWPTSSATPPMCPARRWRNVSARSRMRPPTPEASCWIGASSRRRRGGAWRSRSPTWRSSCGRTTALSG